MTGIVGLVLGAMLVRPALVMDAAGEACRLFALNVMPGLMPYMALSQLVVSRVKHMNPLLLVLLGWGGGSPTGARLLGLCPKVTASRRVSLAVCCATMSPMFLVGTIGNWLESRAAGVCVLAAVLGGGWLSGSAAGMIPRARGETCIREATQPMTLAQAVEQTMRTLLMVCGTMMLWRVLAALLGAMTDRFLPVLQLPLTTLMEVTTGTAQLAALPVPLPLKTALTAGAAGFGGMAIVMQNRAAWPTQLMSLGEQMLWQGLHGVLSFLLALGLMQLMA